MFLLTGFGQSGFLRQQTNVVFPTAFPDGPVEQDFNSFIDINVAANDIAGTNALNLSAVAIVHQPTNGLATVLGGGIIRYTSTVGFSGTDTFSYTVADTVGLASNEAIVTVNVKDAPVDPTPPTVLGHSASCTFNNHVDTDVLTDAVAGTNPIAPATLAIVASPGHGTTALLGAGVIRYTPTTGYSGTDSYTCRVFDTTGLTSNTATVSVNVVAGTSPSVFPKSANCTFNGQVDIDVLADATGGTDVIAPASLVIVTAPGHGATTLIGSGVVRYKPTTDYSGSDTFTYRVSDVVGRVSNTATVSVTIDAGIAPSAFPDSAVCTFNSFKDIDVLANDIGGDNVIAPATLAIVTQSTKGVASLRGGGIIRYTANTGKSGADLFTYHVSDIVGRVSNTANVSIDLQAGVAPTAAAFDAGHCTFNSHIDIDVLAHVTAGTDAISPTTLTINTAPTHGSTSLLGAGIVRYTPTTSYSGADSFKYRVRDIVGRLSNIALVTITVDPDVPPTPTPPTTVLDTVGCGYNSSVDTTVTANDVAGTNPIDTSTVLVATAASPGTAVFQGAGVIRYTAKVGYSGQDSYTYTVADGFGNRSTPGLVTVTVADKPAAPVATDDPTNPCTYHGTASTTVTANDTATSPATIDTTSVIVASQPSQGTAVFQGAGVVLYTSNGNGGISDSYTYTVADSFGTVSNAALVTVQVAAKPAAPVAVADPTNACAYHGTASTTVTTNDTATSPATIDTSTVVVATQPSQGTAVFQSAGVVLYTSNGLGGLSDSYTYTVADSFGTRSAAGLVTVQVAAKPAAPVATGDTPPPCDFHGHIDTTVTANDTATAPATLDLASVVIVASPAQGTATVQGSGVVRYTSTGNSGSDSYTYTVADNFGTVSNAALVSVTVSADNTKFANGYSVRSRVRVPRTLLQTALTTAIFTYDRTVAALKTVANGGNVTSATGLDILFTDQAGIKLSHRIVTYSATTGHLRVHVLIPLTVVNTDFAMFVYAGKTGANEPDATGLYANTISAHNCFTGVDLSGGGLDLTMTNVTAGTAFEEAGQYTTGANGKYLGAGLSSYYGLSNLTVEFWAKPATGDVGTDHGLVCLGKSQSDAFSNHTFVLSMDQQGFYANLDGTTPNTNCYTSTTLLSTASGLDCARIEGASGEQSTAAQHLALLFRSGKLMEQRKNGVPTSPIFVGEGDSSHPPHDHVAGKVLTGTTAAPTGGGLRLGAGPIGSASGTYLGQLAELRIYSSYRTVATMAAEIQSYRDPDSFMGHSTFDASGANQGPVAVPMTATCNVNASADIDVLAGAFEPDGNVMTIRSAANGAVGTTRIVLPFTSGGTYQVLVGDIITGAASNTAATITAVTLTSGSWAGGDAAGQLVFATQSGIWQLENLNVGAHANVATINPTQAFLRYATNDAVATSDNFTFVLTDAAGLQSTGKVSMTITADAEIPTAKNTFTVNSDTQLTQYLNGTGNYGARAPGDMAVMTGTFTLARTFALNGNKDFPYIFKASSKQAATFNGQVKIGGSWQFFWGFKLTRNPTSVPWDGNPNTPANHTVAVQNVGSVGFGGDNNVMRRWEITDWDAPIAVTISGGNNGILDYCEWHNPRAWQGNKGANTQDAASTFEFHKWRNYPSANPPASEVPFRMGVRTAERTPNNGPVDPTSWNFGFKMRRCYIHDIFDKPFDDIYSSGQDDGCEIGNNFGDIAGKTLTCTTLGTGVDHRVNVLTGYFHANHLYEYILFERHAESVNTGAASFDIKCPDCSFKKITMTDCDGRLDMRGGGKQVFEDIVIRRSVGSECSGYGGTITRYKIIGTNPNHESALKLTTGNPGSGLPTDTGFSASINAECQAAQAYAVTQVQAPIECGNNRGPVKVAGCTFTNCGTVNVTPNTMRSTVEKNTQDGQDATVDPTECLISDVGLGCKFFPGEYS